MTDPIADLLTRIRNAQIAKHASVTIPYSQMKAAIIKILYEEGFVGAFKVVENEGRKSLQVSLRYAVGQEPMISEIHRNSRPGRRSYVGYRRVKPVRNGMGMSVLSTPKGILTDVQAREGKIGGELLFTIW